MFKLCLYVVSLNNVLCRHTLQLYGLICLWWLFGVKHVLPVRDKNEKSGLYQILAIFTEGFFCLLDPTWKWMIEIMNRYRIVIGLPRCPITSLNHYCRMGISGVSQPEQPAKFDPQTSATWRMIHEQETGSKAGSEQNGVDGNDQIHFNCHQLDSRTYSYWCLLVWLLQIQASDWLLISAFFWLVAAFYILLIWHFLWFYLGRSGMCWLICSIYSVYAYWCLYN